MLANQASHHIDLLEWMMGDVDSVTAMSARALARIEAEDTAVAILRFRSGALGVVEATTAVRPNDLEGSLSILGERGSVEIGGFAANEPKTWNFPQTTESDATVFEQFGRNPDHSYGFGHAAYYEHAVLHHGASASARGRAGRPEESRADHRHLRINRDAREVELRLNPKRCRLGRG